MTKSNSIPLTPRLFVRLFLLAAFGPVLLFLSAGDLRWTMGWVFAGYMFAYTVFSRLAILAKNPDLIRERIESMKKGNVESWDRVLVPLIGIVLPTSTILLAGLDRRLGWSPKFPLWLQAAAYVPIVLGGLFAQWAVMENAFFSAVVRIQEERGQTVVTTGPYRFVRHPGYAGGLLFNLFLPLALGSLWSFIPVFMHLGLTLVRTSLEDRALIRKLEGYREYAEKTRKRLIPGVW
jgi:protein-S-isoprenylcysteine O-methyltransferase Ste14